MSSDSGDSNIGAQWLSGLSKHPEALRAVERVADLVAIVGALDDHRFEVSDKVELSRNMANAERADLLLRRLCWGLLVPGDGWAPRRDAIVDSWMHSHDLDSLVALAKGLPLLPRHEKWMLASELVEAARDIADALVAATPEFSDWKAADVGLLVDAVRESRDSLGAHVPVRPERTATTDLSFGSELGM